jgi:hypothetical protein
MQQYFNRFAKFTLFFFFNLISIYITIFVLIRSHNSETRVNPLYFEMISHKYGIAIVFLHHLKLHFHLKILIFRLFVGKEDYSTLKK